MRDTSHKIALGGVLASLAVVLMTMGGLIPVATYVCPMLCSLILFTVLNLCGKRIAWAWYGAVSVLSLLLGPDKEAAAVFLAMGYYPIIKPALDRAKCPWIWKGLLFNGITILLYMALLYIIGMEQLLFEFRELGVAGMVLTLILGNISFFLMDNLLWRLSKKYRSRHRARKEE